MNEETRCRACRAVSYTQRLDTSHDVSVLAINKLRSSASHDDRNRSRKQLRNIFPVGEIAGSRLLRCHGARGRLSWARLNATHVPHVAGAALYKQITNCSRRATKRAEAGALDVSWVGVYERQVYLIARSPFSRGKNADNRK